MTMAKMATPRIVCIAVPMLLTAALSAAAGDVFAQSGQLAPDGPSPPAASPPAPAVPQPPPPAPSASAAPTAAAPAIPQQPPPADKPGFLHQLKDWWDYSTSIFDTKSKDARGPVDDLGKKMDDAARSAADAAKGTATATQDAMKNAVEATKGAAATATDAMKNAVEATKNAADAIARLPGTRVVDLHETCAKAANGASDCAAAAANGCRAKGFSGGNPLDVRSAEKCDTKPLQAGNISNPVACASETVVFRAVCQ
jgi:hypothetical protein